MASLDPHSWSIADMVVGTEVNTVVEEEVVEMVTHIVVGMEVKRN